MSLDIIDMEVDPNLKPKKYISIGLVLSAVLGCIGIIFKLLHWPGGAELIIVADSMIGGWFFIKQIFYKEVKGSMGIMTFFALIVSIVSFIVFPIKYFYFILLTGIAIFIPIAYLIGKPRKK